ncbi:putative signaling protein [Pseudidiomarina piscicola]|uniref:Putative signaling protein n=1 Tax=Pseudidiomarina piscicola TaxID=2614830 RepID=A0A6S6WU34_9GAMM|nr:GGDEF domain-containing phosphodiesterase [Pseudidiomarina piscicola]CAB0150581.1 putative signaling protein [Pseudidiomarina piscicola]VZT40081.1 putative signaling protein [Pseudomonas aeruginosa]
MRTLSWWQHLSVQVTALVVGVLTVMVAGLAYFLIEAQQQEARVNAEIELRSGLTVAQGSFNRMYFYQRQVAIDELISELHVHPRISNAAIITPSKELIAVYQPNLLAGTLTTLLNEVEPGQLQKAAETGASMIVFHPQHQHFVAIVPILEQFTFSQQPTPNLLIAEYLHAPAWYQLNTVPWLPLVFMFVAVVGAGILLWFGLQRWAVIPAKQLLAAMNQFGRTGVVDSKQLPMRVPNEFAMLGYKLRLSVRERQQRENKLRQLSAAVEQASESIMMTDLAGNITYVNPAFTEVTGYSSAEVKGKNPRLLASGRTPAKDYQQLWQCLQQGKTWRGELYNRTKDGKEFREWATISPLRDQKGRVTKYLASKLNITQRVEAEAKLEYLAYYNPLTELPNRVSCNQHLARLLEKAEAKQFGIVALFDLDGLQRLNDVRGFAFGDLVLKETADRLRHQGVQINNSYIANLDSDKFALVLPPRRGSRKDLLRQAKQVVAETLAILNDSMLIQGEKVSITASAGIIVYPESAESADTIIRHAETAVHTAKANGGNQTAVYDVSYSTELEHRFEIERELRAAIDSGDLRLYLQAQMSTTGSLLGAEALIRWQHPERGLISPAEFIGIAEQTDLIADIGDWVISQALIELSKLPEPLTLAINISPRHFRKYGFVEQVERHLAHSGADASRLILEVTENLFVDNTADIKDKMQALQKRGVAFSIDDFGTGYSSLAYLRKLPLQELKIDKAFVQSIDDPSQRAIIDSIIAIATNLGFRTVAEGVETKAQADYLAGKDKAMVLQGYLFAKPQPTAEFHQRFVNNLN